MKRFQSNWTSVIVTVCKNKFTPGKGIELRRVLSLVPQRAANYSLLQQLWDAAGNKEKETEIKGCLPIWFPGGRFEGAHELANRKSFSGLMCLDIDGKDNPGKTPEEIKQVLSGWCNDKGVPYVGYAGLSCRRRGVFVLVRVPERAQIAEEYKRYYAAIEEEIKQQYGIVIDKCSSNPAQARIISFDDEPIFNEFPAVWDKQKEGVEVEPTRLRCAPPNGEWRKSTGELIEYVVQAAEYANEPLFYSEKEWWQLCVALTSNFGESGRSWFIRLSNVWSNALGQLQKTDPDRFYTEQMNKASYAASIGFIINKAKSGGLLK